nr:hypothetical protein CFP56_76486 [Quercus suber]
MTFPFGHTRDGIFSVRSGCHLLLDQDETEVAGNSNQGENLKVWKSIWGLRVLNRVKSLLWRAETNSLPTQANLVKRHVLDDALCQECKLHLEDVMHAFWSCLNLNDAWRVHFEKLKMHCNKDCVGETALPLRQIPSSAYDAL